MYLKKAMSGDITALNHLLDQYKDVAYTIAYRILRNREDTEDAVQDSFIRVFKYIRRFRNDSQFSTWLYRIVFNECMRIRKDNLQKPFTDVAEDGPVIDNTLDKMLETERKRIIREALDKLHPKESLILTLYYLEEKSIKEIHFITQLSKPNIRVILFRARKHLYIILQRRLR